MSTNSEGITITAAQRFVGKSVNVVPNLSPAHSGLAHSILEHF